MLFMPFVCLGAGILAGVAKLPAGVMRFIDWVVNVALLLLMITIGLNIGLNEIVMKNLHTIGLQCLVITFLAIFFSIALTFALEKTVVPLEAVLRILKERESDSERSGSRSGNCEAEHKEGFSWLTVLMPAGMITGIVIGLAISVKGIDLTTDLLLTASLALLYTGVGVSLGGKLEVFAYIKELGFRILFIPLAVLAGSLLGGVLSGLVLGLPLHVPVLAAGGMSYYSLTGAYMTSSYGIETGTFGFVVNVMREFFTVLLLPLLARISKGSPMASGAAGNMDTMLMPITRLLGPEMGIVTLIIGVILTFAVPVLLPVLNLVIQNFL